MTQPIQQQPQSSSQQDVDEQNAPDSIETDSVEEEASDLSLDVVFEILKNRRRRLVMHELKSLEGDTTLGDLAEHIAGIENDKDPSALGAQERKRVYVGLYQCHLPKMDEAGVIDFEQNRGTVSIGSNADQVYDYLEDEPVAEPQWERYYLSYAMASGGTFLLAAALLPSVTMGVFVLSLLGLIGLATIHSRHEPEE